MTDINFILPDGGIIQDTEEDFEIISPDMGIYNEQAPASVTGNPWNYYAQMQGAQECG